MKEYTVGHRAMLLLCLVACANTALGQGVDVRLARTPAAVAAPNAPAFGSRVAGNGSSGAASSAAVTPQPRSLGTAKHSFSCVPLAVVPGCIDSLGRPRSRR